MQSNPKEINQYGEAYTNYSVVISSTGRSKYLLELLDSLEAQTTQPAEVIVLLDNNKHSHECKESIENTRSELRLNIQLLKDKNLPAKRNIGVRIANSEVIMFSDDDDIWMPMKAEQVLSAMSRGYNALCHNFSCFGAEEKANCNKNGRESKLLKQTLMLQGDNIYGGGSSICCTKSLAVAVPFDISLESCEDLDWWIRIQLCGTRIYYLGEDLVSYRRHSTNMGKNKWRMASTLFRVGANTIGTGVTSATSGTAMIIKSMVRAMR